MAVCLSICLMLKLLSSYDRHSTYPSFPSRALRSEKHTGAPQCRIRGEILYLSWTDRETGEQQLQHNMMPLKALANFSYSGSGLCDRLILDLLLAAQRDPWMRLWSFWHDHVLLLFILHHLLIITLYCRLQTQSVCIQKNSK